MTTLEFQHVITEDAALNAVLPVGLHVWWSRPVYAVDDLLELAAGRSKPRRGRVLLDGSPPFREPGVRRTIASNLLPTLMGADTLRHAIEHTAALRGQKLEEVLTVLAELTDLPEPDDRGKHETGKWLERDPRALTEAERAVVALALCLSYPKGKLILLRDPFSVRGIDARWLRQRIVSLAEHSVCVVTTRELRAAEALGGSRYEFDRGVLSSVRRPLEAPPTMAGGSFLLAVDQALPLLSALLEGRDVRHVSVEPGPAENSSEEDSGSRRFCTVRVDLRGDVPDAEERVSGMLLRLAAEQRVRIFWLRSLTSPYPAVSNAPPPGWTGTAYQGSERGAP